MSEAGWNDRKGAELLMTLPEGERCTALYHTEDGLFADTTCGRFKFVRGRFVLENPPVTGSA